MPDPPYPKPSHIHDKDTTDEWEATNSYIPPGTHRVDLTGTFPVIEVLTSISQTGPSTWGSYVWERLALSPGPRCGATIESPAAGIYPVYLATNACTVTNVRAYQDAGTGSTVNAAKGSAGSPSRFLSSDLTIGSADTFVNQAADQNTSISAGDAIFVEIVTVSGSPSRIAIQVDLTRP